VSVRRVAQYSAPGTQTGTFCGIPATGQRICTQELVVYRLARAEIAEVWGDLGSAVRDELGRRRRTGRRVTGGSPALSFATRGAERRARPP